MGLSTDLISQFVKVTKDETPKKQETTVYGTTVDNNGMIFVKLDGSDLLTPVETTANVKADQRVTVMIKNHTATITGNLSAPSASSDDIDDQITEVEILIADKVSTDEFDAEVGRIDDFLAKTITTDDLTADNAVISKLLADYAKVEDLEAESGRINNLETNKLDAEIADITYATIKDLEATNLDVYNLSSTYADFELTTTNKLIALEAEIDNIDVGDLSADYANIDFSNIGIAAIEQFYATSGLIENLTINDGTITGNLIGVTIKGDQIEAGTLIADRLVLQGEDGLYYQLNTNGVTIETEQTEYNSLNGSVIAARSIAATKIDVEDLTAFEATIGGFVIDDDSIHSVAKTTATNTTRGIYLDNEGQMAVGDNTNYIKYYKDENDEFVLDISAGSISLGAEKKSVETLINDTAQASASNAMSYTDKAVVDALTEYVKNGDLELLETTLRTEFKQDSDSFQINFDKLEQYITSVEGELHAQYEATNKYIRFVDGRIVLGIAGNELLLKMQNDRIQFVREYKDADGTIKEAEVAFFSNTKLSATELEATVSMTIGPLKITPRANRSIDINMG